MGKIDSIEEQHVDDLQQKQQALAHRIASLGFLFLFINSIYKIFRYDIGISFDNFQFLFFIANDLFLFIELIKNRIIKKIYLYIRIALSLFGVFLLIRYNFEDLNLFSILLLIIIEVFFWIPILLLTARRISSRKIIISGILLAISIFSNIYFSFLPSFLADKMVELDSAKINLVSSDLNDGFDLLNEITLLNTGEETNILDDNMRYFGGNQMLVTSHVIRFDTILVRQEDEELQSLLEMEFSIICDDAESSMQKPGKEKIGAGGISMEITCDELTGFSSVFYKSNVVGIVSAFSSTRNIEKEDVTGFLKILVDKIK